MTDHEDRAEEGSTFEEISRDDCLALLAGQVVGRVAVAEFGAAPLVVPVNYALDGDTVVFRTDYGSKFRLAVLAEQPVSFEIDGLDPGHRSGWSVLLTGDAVEIEEPDAPGASVQPWAPGTKDHRVRIVPDSITGRRIRLAPVWGFDGRGYL